MREDARGGERAARCRRPHARAADPAEKLGQSQDDEDEREHRRNSAYADLILRWRGTNEASTAARAPVPGKRRGAAGCKGQA